MKRLVVFILIVLLTACGIFRKRSKTEYEPQAEDSTLVSDTVKPLKSAFSPQDFYKMRQRDLQARTKIKRNRAKIKPEQQPKDVPTREVEDDNPSRVVLRVIEDGRVTYQKEKVI